MLKWVVPMLCRCCWVPGTSRPHSADGAEQGLMLSCCIMVLHPNPHCNIGMPAASGPGMWMLFVKCFELPQKEKILLQQTRLFWRSFSGPCSFRTVVVVTAVSCLVCVFSMVCLACCDVRGREVAWCLCGKLIISGIVIWSLSCEYGFRYLQKQQWQIIF